MAVTPALIPGRSFRVAPTDRADRWLFQRFDGRASGSEVWTTIDTCSRELADDRLALVEGRITKNEFSRRFLARRSAAAKAREPKPARAERMFLKHGCAT